MTNPRNNPRTLSLAALTVLELEPDEMIRVARQAGYDNVGLRLIAATEEEIGASIVVTPNKLQAVKSALSETGIGVLDIEILRLRPDTNVEAFSEVLEMGAELGATEVLVAGNDPDKQRITDNFSALCELSKPLGLGINLEFMPWTDVKNLAQAAAILHEVTEDNAGLLIDAFHLNRSGSEISDIYNLPKKWFRYGQLCDIEGEIPADMDEILRQGRSERCFPGAGDIDLSSLLTALPQSLPLSIEVPADSLKEQGLSALQRVRLAYKYTLEVLQQSPK